MVSQVRAGGGSNTEERHRRKAEGLGQEEGDAYPAESKDVTANAEYLLSDGAVG